MSKLFLIICFLVGGVVGPDYNPEQWVDQADLSNPTKYVETMTAISEQKLLNLKINRGMKQPGLEWKSDHNVVAFSAKDRPDLMTLNDVLLEIFSRLDLHKRMSLRIKSQSPKEEMPEFVEFERRLLARGLTRAELNVLNRFVNTSLDNQLLLFTEMVSCRSLKLAALAEGVPKEIIAKASDTDPIATAEALSKYSHSARVALKYDRLEPMTRADHENLSVNRRTHYLVAEKQLMAEFLSSFNLRARRILLTFGVESNMERSNMQRSVADEQSLEQEVDRNFKNWDAARAKMKETKS